MLPGVLLAVMLLLFSEDAGILLLLLDVGAFAAAALRNAARSLCCTSIGVFSCLNFLACSRELRGCIAGSTIELVDVKDESPGLPVDRVPPGSAPPPSISTLPAPDTSSRNDS